MRSRINRRSAQAIARGGAVRFLDKWNGGSRRMEPCSVFYGLPTPGVRAWVDAGRLIDARKRLINAAKFAAADRRPRY